MNKELIVVLGMHRSGTSVLTKGISEIGYYVGKTAEGKEDNQKGFFENEELVRLNEHILDEFSIRWKTIDYLYIDRCETFIDFLKERYFQRAYNIIENLFQNSNKCVIKDPRVSILMPFWERILNKMDINVKYVLALRSPDEVAQSLINRKDMDYKSAIDLWLYYNISIMKKTNHDMIVINYDNIISDTKETLIRLCDWLQIDSKSKMNKIHEFSENFVEKDFKHCDNNTTMINSYENLMFEFLNKDYLYVKDMKEFLNNNLNEYELYLNADKLPLLNKATRVYINTTSGENKKISVDLQDTFEQNICVDKEYLENVQNIIFQPVEDDCIFILNSIKSSNGKNVNIVSTNAVYIKDNVYIFSKYSKIYLECSNIENKSMFLSFSIYPMDRYTLSIMYKIKEREKFNDL